MKRQVFRTKRDLSAAAAKLAADAIRNAIEVNGEANIVLATGVSQFEVLEHLVAAEGVEWPKVTMFHLDEYIGLSMDHPASLRRYLKERFTDKVRLLRATHLVNGEAGDPEAECQRLSGLISGCDIDVTLGGIGENGHLAFNDPSADFETEQPYIVVELDEKCRRQQLGEGWFTTLDDVPRRAVSMSVRQIMKSKLLVISAPDKRKAEAVKGAVEGPVTPQCPASILQEHPNCVLLLDEASASLLSHRR